MFCFSSINPCHDRPPRHTAGTPCDSSRRPIADHCGGCTVHTLNLVGPPRSRRNQIESDYVGACRGSASSSSRLRAASGPDSESLSLHKSLQARWELVQSSSSFVALAPPAPSTSCDRDAPASARRQHDTGVQFDGSFVLRPSTTNDR
jgi:hypothetical protein